MAPSTRLPDVRMMEITVPSTTEQTMASAEMNSVIPRPCKRKRTFTQVKSSIGYKEDQGKTLRALGLGKINRSVEQVDNESVRGMIFKVKHLVKVEEI